MDKINNKIDLKSIKNNSRLKMNSNNCFSDKKIMNFKKSNNNHKSNLRNYNLKNIREKNANSEFIEKETTNKNLKLEKQKNKISFIINKVRNNQLKNRSLKFIKFEENKVNNILNPLNNYKLKNNKNEEFDYDYSKLVIQYNKNEDVENCLRNFFKKENKLPKIIKNKYKKILVTLFNTKKKIYNVIKDINMNNKEIYSIIYKYNKFFITEIKFIFKSNKNINAHIFNKSKKKLDSKSILEKQIIINNKITKIFISYKQNNIYNLSFIDDNEIMQELIDLKFNNKLKHKFKEINNKEKIIGFISSYDNKNILCKFQMIKMIIN